MMTGQAQTTRALPGHLDRPVTIARPGPRPAMCLLRRE
jgi:hypothetical protein